VSAGGAPSTYRWRTVGFFALAVSLAAFLLMIRLNARHNFTFVDLRVYYWGGVQVHAHHPVYDLAYHRTLPFTYSPFALMLFTVLSLVPFAVVKYLFIIVSITAISLATWFAWGIAGYGHRPTRLVATLLITAVALWLEPVQQTVALGQIDAILMVIIIADCSMGNRSRAHLARAARSRSGAFVWRHQGWEGLGIGVTTGVKLVLCGSRTAVYGRTGWPSTCWWLLPVSPSRRGRTAGARN
jgi:hypothetical protein